MGRSLVFGLLALTYFLCLLAEAQADYKPVERKPVYKPDEQKKEEEVKKPVYKPEEEKKYKPDFKAKPHYKADDDENEKKYKPGYKYRPHYKADDDDDEDKKKYKSGYKYKPHYKADDDKKKYKPGYKYKPHYDDEDDEDDEKENKPGYYRYKPHYKAGHEHKEYKRNKDEEDKPSYKYQPQYKAKPVYKADEEKRYRPGYKKTYKPVYKSVEKPEYKSVEKPEYKPVEKPVYKPVEKPVYKPAEKPTYEKIAVEGYVYCRDRYSKKPVERAVVSLTCTKSKASMEQKTNAYGYFYFPLSYGAYKGIDVSTLKVSLVSSPSKNCNVVTNVNNGKSGAVLDKNKSKIVGETLIYEVGPFAFVPPAPVYDAPKYPYHS